MSVAGQVFVLSGPPGAGKSTLGKRLRQRFADLAYSVSLTTREPRPGEVHGVDYVFLSREEFLAKVASGEMLEHVEVFGNLYGTSAAAIRQSIDGGRDLLLEIEVNGGLAVKRTFPQAVMVFLLPPSPAELERRLRGRGTEDEAKIRGRLERVAYELAQARHYTHLVVNDDLERAVEEVAALLTAERLRLDRRWPLVAPAWGL